MPYELLLPRVGFLEKIPENIRFTSTSFSLYRLVACINNQLRVGQIVNFIRRIYLPEGFPIL